MTTNLPPTVSDYETRQVDRAFRDAITKYDGNARNAAAAYGADVLAMLSYRPEYWNSLGLIRLYTRIAVRLANSVQS
jgi:hypothetical protein